LAILSSNGMAWTGMCFIVLREASPKQREHEASVHAYLIQGIHQDHQLLARHHKKLLSTQAARRSAAANQIVAAQLRAIMLAPQLCRDRLRLHDSTEQHMHPRI